MEQRLVIRSLPQAFEMVKEMGLCDEWESDHRVCGRRAIVDIFEQRMRDRIDRHLEEMGRRGGGGSAKREFFEASAYGVR